MATDKTPVAQAADEDTTVPEAEEIEAVEGEEAEADESEEEAEGEAETEADGQPKKLSKSARQKAKFRERIAVLTDNATRERQRADAAEAQLRGLTDEAGPEPKEADYEGRPNDYIADRAAWKADQSAIARQKKAVETQAVESRKSAGQSGDELFRERVRALEDSHPGIGKAIFDDGTLPINPTMAEVIRDSERGPEVAFYLSSHREVAQRIQSMTPLAAARELGRIEATLDAPKPRTRTQAPPPPVIVGGTSHKVIKDPDRMTTAEWMKYEEDRMERQRKRK